MASAIGVHDNSEELVLQIRELLWTEGEQGTERGEQRRVREKLLHLKLFPYYIPVFRIALLFPELLQLVALSAVTLRL